jgi:hypothetical protein
VGISEGEQGKGGRMRGQKPVVDYDKLLDCFAEFMDRINELLDHVVVPDDLRPGLEVARMELMEQLLAARNPAPFHHLN